MTAGTDDIPLIRHLMLLVLAGLLLGLPGLGNSLLWDQDEGFYASTASEMHERSDWITPTFNKELFAHKPPVMYWGMMLGIRSFGLSEWSVRIVSVFMGLGTSLVTYLIGRKIFSGREGAIAAFYGALALLSSIFFSIVARSATADAYLCFFIASSLWCWLSATEHSHQRSNSAKSRFAVWWWVGCYSAMGLAVLTKGPIGFLFPMTIIGWVTWQQIARRKLAACSSPSWMRRWFGFLDPRSFVNALWEMKAFYGILIIVTISTPWFWAVELQSGGEFLAEFFGVHHWQRFSQPMDNHSGPWYYYPVSCLVGLFPWSAFAIPVGISVYKNYSKAEFGFQMLLSWITVYFLVFSLASTKLPNYVLPAYPALALLVGSFVASWNRQQEFRARWIPVGWSMLSVVGGSLILPRLVSQAPWVAEKVNTQQLQLLIDALLWLSFPLLLTGLIGLACYFRGAAIKARRVMASVAVIWILVFWLRVVPVVDQYQGSQRLVKAVSAINHQESARITSFRCFRPSLVFYHRDRVDFLGMFMELNSFCRASEESYVILSEDDYSEWVRPKSLTVEPLETVKQFPWQSDLILLKVTNRKVVRMASQ